MGPVFRGGNEPWVGTVHIDPARAELWFPLIARARLVATPDSFPHLPELGPW
jgi:hypothetical protein